MMAALQIVLFGALSLVAQDLGGLAVDVGSAEPGLAYRLADLDGNGEQDLILPAVVYFQRSRSFSERMKAPCPAAADSAATCDVWDDTLYVRTSGRLQKVRWNGREWSVSYQQQMAWPDPGGQELLSIYAAPSSLRFERFLHDIDGDGEPEIIIPTEQGLCVFRGGADGSYQDPVQLDVFPPLRLARIENQSLWPDVDRRLSFPARTMNCRFNIDGNEIDVVTREDCPTMTLGMLARIRRKHFTVDADALQVVDAETREETTEPFPPHLQLVRLNDDEVVDIGGGNWQVVQSSLLPMPIYETRASVDGGKTFRTLRVTGFRPNQSFLDYDHDGKRDMVTESTDLFEGGVRDTMSRLCTSSELKHEVRIYLQNGPEGFGQKADVAGEFQIQLESTPMRGGIMFERYQSGELFNLTGNSNGDKWNDAVVQDRPDRLALFMGGPEGFEDHPSATIPINSSNRFTVADYDGDGRADLGVHSYSTDEGRTVMDTRLYLTREGGV